VHDAGHGYDVFGANARWVARAARVTKLVHDRYFRVVSRGAENIPKSGPALLVANHGGTLPVDAIMLWTDVLEHTHPPRLPRPIADHFLLQLPYVGTLAMRTGSVGGTRGNVEKLLESGELLLVFPEGVRGMAKGFSRRYELGPFTVGHAELSLRYRAPIVPTAIIGAEEQMPQVGRLPLRVFGAPYLPVPLSPIPLPVRYRILYGSPIALHAEHPPESADDPRVLTQAAERVRHAVERLIDEGLRERDGIFR
jgi:1-acyl-sn-glycerol-3-phosphate acyltransferase